MISPIRVAVTIKNKQELKCWIAAWRKRLPAIKGLMLPL
jgi:hypothetical protein